jgi:hypothetical protein
MLGKNGLLGGGEGEQENQKLTKNLYSDEWSLFPT